MNLSYMLRKYAPIPSVTIFEGIGDTILHQKYMYYNFFKNKIIISLKYTLTMVLNW